jgi:hypothetical protein
MHQKTYHELRELLQHTWREERGAPLAVESSPSRHVPPRSRSPRAESRPLSSARRGGRRRRLPLLFPHGGAPVGLGCGRPSGSSTSSAWAAAAPSGGAPPLQPRRVARGRAPCGRLLRRGARSGAPCAHCLPRGPHGGAPCDRLLRCVACGGAPYGRRQAHRLEGSREEKEYGGLLVCWSRGEKIKIRHRVVVWLCWAGVRYFSRRRTSLTKRYRSFFVSAFPP